MVQRVVLAVVLVLASISAAAQGKDKVRVCHFSEEGDVALLSIAPNALPAHLAHGDVEAPTGVRVAADCLTPQPPPAPVAQTATTGADGRASFVIPSTNVIARFVVTDAGGAPVPGTKVQIMVIGDDWLAIGADSGSRLAPAFAEGKLSDARAGSALRILIALVRHAYNTGFPAGGGFLHAGNINFPTFISTHFTAVEQCFTQQEFQAFAGASWRTALLIGAAVIATGGGALGTAAGVVGIPISAETNNAAGSLAQHMYAGKTLPMKTRVWGAPPILGLQLLPFWYEDLGPCGGGCCIPNGLQCELVSAPGKCIGNYLDATPCTPPPCKKGACCDPASATCTIVTEVQCNAVGRVYKGDDTTCSPNPCPFGACCSPTAGCIETQEILCPAIQGTFKGHGSKCSANPCNTGACCDPRTGCVVVTDVECASRGGTFHGYNTTCDRIPGATTLRYTVQSSGTLGGVVIPIPFTHGDIKTKVTIPGNSSGNQCNRNWRVEIFVFPFSGGRSGGFWDAGQQFSICHTAPETITFTQLNPGTPCSRYYVNAVTGSTSTIEVEIKP